MTLNPEATSMLSLFWLTVPVLVLAQLTNSAVQPAAILVRKRRVVGFIDAESNKGRSMKERRMEFWDKRHRRQNREGSEERKGAEERVSIRSPYFFPAFLISFLIFLSRFFFRDFLILIRSFLMKLPLFAFV